MPQQIPDRPTSSVEPMADWSDVRAVYDAFDESHSYLGEGFNSFGYWDGLSPREPNAGTLAALQMYDVVASPLVLGSEGRILELGSGMGRGTANLCDRNAGFQFIGVDLSVSQVRKALSLIDEARRGRLAFAQADASRLPFSDEQFTGALSIEAIQHIPVDSHPRLFQEVHRVLVPEGVFSFATFLLKNDNSEGVSNLLWTVQERFDHLISVERIAASAKDAGFKTIDAKPLGDHIFHEVYDLVQDKTNSWQGSNLDSFRQAALSLFGGFRDAFDRGWLDYYRFVCSK